MDLTPFDSFEQITSDDTLKQSLISAYGDISKADLWVDALAETPESNEGSQLRELSRSIIVKQFTELWDSIRVWYQNYLSDIKLRLVNDVTLASVIRANTSIEDEIPDKIFMASDEPEPEGFLGMTFFANSLSAKSNPADDNIVRVMESKVGYLSNGSWIRLDNFDHLSSATSRESLLQ